MRFHVIPINEKENILFFPDNISYFTANNITTDLVSCISENIQFEKNKGKISKSSI